MKEAVSLKVPSATTLKKYGLTADDWQALAEKQAGACFVCQKVPSSGRLCVDHEHVRAYKKLPPEVRKLYVRGLLCFFCNLHYCGRAITVKKSLRVTEYLQAYAARRPS